MYLLDVMSCIMDSYDCLLGEAVVVFRPCQIKLLHMTKPTVTPPYKLTTHLKSRIINCMLAQILFHPARNTSGGHNKELILSIQNIIHDEHESTNIRIKPGLWNDGRKDKELRAIWAPVSVSSFLSFFSVINTDTLLHSHGGRKAICGLCLTVAE